MSIHQNLLIEDKYNKFLLKLLISGCVIVKLVYPWPDF